jgi:tellurite resistance protein TehA-like permease
MIGCFYAVLLICFPLAITRLRQNHGLDNLARVTIWLILPPFCYSAVALWAIVNLDVDVDEV